MKSEKKPENEVVESSPTVTIEFFCLMYFTSTDKRSETRLQLDCDR